MSILRVKNLWTVNSPGLIGVKNNGPKYPWLKQREDAFSNSY